jgi:hypothetical protein
MSLVHIRYNDGGVWCSHSNPQAWTTDTDEASCCDCVLAYMSDELRKVREEAVKALQQLAKERGGS